MRASGDECVNNDHAKTRGLEPHASRKVRVEAASRRTPKEHSCMPQRPCSARHFHRDTAHTSELEPAFDARAIRTAALPQVPNKPGLHSKRKGHLSQTASVCGRRVDKKQWPTTPGSV